MYLSRWFRSNVKFSIQCAINSLAFRKKCYPVEIMFIMGEAHPWLCSVANGFFHCKIELETRILRVQTPYIPRRVVFKVWGAGDHLLWGGGGGGEREQIWLFSLCGCLELSDYWTFPSWVTVERSHVYEFQAAEKYLSLADRDCTCWIHH